MKELKTFLKNYFKIAKKSASDLNDEDKRRTIYLTQGYVEGYISAKGWVCKRDEFYKFIADTNKLI